MNQSTANRTLTGTVPTNLAGERLDKVLAKMFPSYSRSRIQAWIKSGHVLVNQHQMRARDTVTGGDSVEITVIEETETHWQAQDIPLDVIYEDEAIIVINKPAGLVVHPGAGNKDGTLSNALLHFDNNLQNVPRSGIVHRLDKDTSGLLVVARNLESQTQLAIQIQQRTMKREYEALVVGVMTAGGVVDKPIGRHPVNRLRMAINARGKVALTHYRVIQKMRAHTHIKVSLETGRTHQIRVHMASLRHPIVGDQTYGGRLVIPPSCIPEFEQVLRQFKRQALHAACLTVVHPLSKKTMSWCASLPQDMEKLVAAAKLDFESRK